MKKSILCADDYGQNAAISQAIINLLKIKQLSAVSCLVTSSYWRTAASALQAFQDQVDIGLHFNLTEGQGYDSLNKLLIKSHLRQLNKEAMMTECHTQIDQFVAQMGRLPDFLDGHQHVHQLPIVRDAVIAVYNARLREKKAYIRSVYIQHVWRRFNERSFIKQLILQLCGARTFKRQLIKNNIPHNSSFAGVYRFNQDLDYAILFPRFLKQVEGGGLIMCHPGLPSDDLTDSIATARVREYDYLTKR